VLNNNCTSCHVRCSFGGQVKLNKFTFGVPFFYDVYLLVVFYT
jgi:hypothetical protein